MAKIYVASSWRNTIQPAVVESLRQHGHRVYDFKNPKPGDKGFHWSEIDPEWQSWTKEKYRACLDHSIAINGFLTDLHAMQWANVFVGVMPFGRSASIEMGWAAGQEKKTILLLSDGEPELMVKVFDHICCTLEEVLERIGSMKFTFADFKKDCEVCGTYRNSGFEYCPECGKRLREV